MKILFVTTKLQYLGACGFPVTIYDKAETVDSVTLEKLFENSKELPVTFSPKSGDPVFIACKVTIEYSHKCIPLKAFKEFSHAEKFIKRSIEKDEEEFIKLGPRESIKQAYKIYVRTVNTVNRDMDYLYRSYYC